MAEIRWSFGNLPPPSAARAGGPPPRTTRIPTTGSIFADRYQVGASLGRGACGQVFRARDLSTGRDVALKVILGSVDTNARARFEREGELIASLRHPGVVRVHAGGFTGDDVPFLVLELVEDARTLGPIVSEQPERALDLLLEVTRAVAFVHAQGLVHRDLKPENVLVDREGRPRICDFGLAWREDLDRLTKTGHIVGTPLYMPPEAFGPDPHSGPAADVWSLGVMLYETLAGTHPYPGDASLLEHVARLSEGPPPSPRELRPDLPEQLVAVCERALQPDPTRRYADAGAMLEALEAACSGSTPGPRAALGVGARWVLPLGLLLSTLGAAVALGSLPPRRTAAEPSRAEARERGPRPAQEARRLLSEGAHSRALDVLTGLDAPPPDLVWEAALPLVAEHLERSRFDEAQEVLDAVGPARSADPESTRARRRELVRRCIARAVAQGGRGLTPRAEAPTRRQAELLRVAVRLRPLDWEPPGEDLVKIVQRGAVFAITQRRTPNRGRNPQLTRVLVSVLSTLRSCADLAPRNRDVQCGVAQIQTALIPRELPDFTAILWRAYRLSKGQPGLAEQMRYILAKHLLQTAPRAPETAELMNEALAGPLTDRQRGYLKAMWQQR